MCTIIISRVTCFKLAKLVTVGAYISRERYVSSGQNFAGILSVLNLIANGWTNGSRLSLSLARMMIIKTETMYRHIETVHYASLNVT